jgi:hypothetical protein
MYAKKRYTLFSLAALLCLITLLSSCSQTPTTFSDAERFTATLKNNTAQPTLQNQASGERLPDGNYLCVERLRGGKALGLIIEGNTYKVAMSYSNGRFSNWQSGTYDYNVTWRKPYEAGDAFRTVLKDYGVVTWLSGPMTAWYRIQDNYTIYNPTVNLPVVFNGKRTLVAQRLGAYTYTQKEVGEISFYVWSTPADCSETNFVNYGNVW